MSSSPTKKRTRCAKGTRKNKKTGNCESVLDNTCAICLDRIIAGNIKTKCKHNFHNKCLTGWCKSQKMQDIPSCPICRADIKDTCKKLMPFDSHEVFRYTEVSYGSKKANEHKVDRLTEIIHNPKFDINVTYQDLRGDSILWELNDNKYSYPLFKPLIEFLLKKPDIIVSNELVSDLISRRHNEAIVLFKKYKKIPQHLKSLV
jgi:hypothetical protein